MSINTADKVPNSDIAELMSSLSSEDYTIEFKGYTHSKQGFVLQLSFVEHINDIDQWTNISEKYTCEIDIDMNNHCVNLYFEKKKIKKWISSTLIYLSVMCVSIYYLWNKYQPLQNYTNLI